ncbi:putative SP-containing protein [Vairimorpha necatrix]|uniref:SP-containing protein n=1 Tax=Vairimorpha necatrix TaxID=6039 RepID=A0AAX4JEX4_9MICR
MFCKILLLFIFGCCQLTITLNYKENEVFCDLYIGISDEDYKFSEYKIFLSGDIKNQYAIKMSSYEVRNCIKNVSNLLPLEEVDMNDHEKIKKLANTFKDQNIYNNFINSFKYYKYKFNTRGFKYFCFEIVSFDKRNLILSWEHSQIFFFCNANISDKLDMQIKKNLATKDIFFDVFLENVDKFILLKDDDSNLEIQQKFGKTDIEAQLHDTKSNSNS